MSLDSLELELGLDRAEAIALLQPFVDNELGDQERELVARQIADNPEYQAFVREQQQVRAALQSLVLEAAPAQLREQVLAELDAIEAEQRRGVLAPIIGRIKSFGRGAMLMVPAAAAACVLFLVASSAGWLEAGKHIGGAPVDAGIADSLQRPDKPSVPTHLISKREIQRPADAPGLSVGLPSAEALAERGEFAVQVAPPRSLPSDVALVSDAATSPSSAATVRYRVGDGTIVVDHQRRAGSEPEAKLGAHQVFRGHPYRLARDELGRPSVAFQVGGVHHQLVLDGSPGRVDAAVGVDEPDFRVLMMVADALRQAHGGVGP